MTSATAQIPHYHVIFYRDFHVYKLHRQCGFFVKDEKLKGCDCDSEPYHPAHEDPPKETVLRDNSPEDHVCNKEWCEPWRANVAVLFYDRSSRG